MWRTAKPYDLHLTTSDQFPLPNDFVIASDGSGGTSVGLLDFVVNSTAALNAALKVIDLGGSKSAPNTNYTITFGSSFTLNGELFAINLASGDTLTIDGANQTLDGGNTYRGFLVDTGAVTIKNLTISHTLAQGGTGGAASIGAGGGGAGLGGGLFVAAGAQVTLAGVTFSGDVAEGGAGGSFASAYFGGFPIGGGGGSAATAASAAAASAWAQPEGQTRPAATASFWVQARPPGIPAAAMAVAAARDSTAMAMTPASAAGSAARATMAATAGSAVSSGSAAAAISRAAPAPSAVAVATAGPAAKAGLAAAAVTAVWRVVKGASVVVPDSAGCTAAVAADLAPVARFSSSRAARSSSTGPAASRATARRAERAGPVTATAMGPPAQVSGAEFSCRATRPSRSLRAAGKRSSSPTTSRTRAAAGDPARMPAQAGSRSTEPGTVVLSGNNNFTGGITISGDGTVLSVASGSNLGIWYGKVALGDGTTLQLSAGFTLSQSVTLAGSVTIDMPAAQTVTVSSSIADGTAPGHLIQIGGTLVLNDATYSGGTDVENGTLQLDNSRLSGDISDNNGGLILNSTRISGNVSDNGPLTLNNSSISGLVTENGTLELNDSGISGNISIDNGTLQINNGSNNLTLAGAISGSGGVEQDGSGILVLSGRSSYAGGTQIDSGGLELGNAGAAGTGAVTLASGARETLRIDGTAMPSNTIAGFAEGDVIDLAGVAFDPQGGIQLEAGNLLHVVENGQSYDLQLAADDTFPANQTFVVGSDGQGGTDITCLQEDYVVNSTADLNAALKAIDIGGLSSGPGAAYTITFGSAIMLDDELWAINLASGDTLTIDGAGNALDGAGTYHAASLPMRATCPSRTSRSITRSPRAATPSRSSGTSTAPAPAAALASAAGCSLRPALR